MALATVSIYEYFTLLEVDVVVLKFHKTIVVHN